MTTIEKIVTECLEKHEGGAEYFDLLDSKFRETKNQDLVNNLLENVQTKLIVVTGEFGKVILENHLAGNSPDNIEEVIWVNGGLRKSDKIIKTITSGVTSLRYRKYTFVDDSYYSGNTFNTIKKHLFYNYDMNCDIIQVLYDGSLEIDNKVVSFYRYHK